MLTQAKRLANENKIVNATWLEQSAEQLTPVIGTFRLTTIGYAFHWMNRDAVLRFVCRQTEPHGGLAIIDAGNPQKWTTTESYQKVTKEIIRRWLGDRRRAGSGYRTPPSENHEAVVARSPFCRHKKRQYTCERCWTIDQIVGYCYSTSYCNPKILGDKKKPFER